MLRRAGSAILLALALAFSAHAANWYVNDAVTAGDSFTTTTGNDSNSGAFDSPFLTIQRALVMSDTSDTIFVDSGIYSDTIYAYDDSITIMGSYFNGEARLDSNSLGSQILNPPQASQFAAVQIGHPGAATTIPRQFIIVRRMFINITGARCARVSRSQSNMISECRLISSNDICLYISDVGGGGDGGSDSNRFENNFMSTNSSDIVNMSAGNNFNFFETNTIRNGGSGFGGFVVESGRNLFSNNIVETTIQRGFDLSVSTSINNRIFGGRVGKFGVSFSAVDVRAQQSGGGSTVDSVTVTGPGGTGIRVDDGIATITNNQITGATSQGMSLASNAASCTVTGNVIRQNTGGGISLVSANGNYFAHNRSFNNTGGGLTLDGSSNNRFIQCDFDSNNTHQISLVNSSNSDTFIKCNIIARAPDTRAFIHNAAGTITISRSWWNTTDEAIMRDVYIDTNDTRVVFIPYRLGMVDTRAGADTSAPQPPSAVSLSSPYETQVIVLWTIPTTHEETNVANNLAFGGAKIYRITAVDTTNWGGNLVWTADATDTEWDDTGVTVGTYRYRLTSRDTATPYVNESFFTSDTQTVVVTAAAVASLQKKFNAAVGARMMGIYGREY